MTDDTWKIFNTHTGKVEVEGLEHFEAAKLSTRLPAYRMGLTDKQIDAMNSFSSQITHKLESQYIFSYPSPDICRARFFVSIVTEWTEGWNDGKSTVSLDYDRHDHEDRIHLFTETAKGRPSSQMGETILGFILDKLKWDFSDHWPNGEEQLRHLKEAIRSQWAVLPHP